MADEYTSWQPEPNGRGTWSILLSCVITLVLCVYTAVHPNIPVASESTARKWMTTVSWTLAGIFAPEVVTWTAWSQRAEAKKLSQDLQEIKQMLSTTQEASCGNGYGTSEVTQLVESWTLKHSFFVVMGGFQLRPADAFACSCDPDQQHSHLCLPRSVLRPSGLLALLKDGHGNKIPFLTEKEIDDRSKADRLAKVLSCLQGFWLIARILGQLANHLAITELEMNTVAHVLCTVVMYISWWDNPLRIEQPIFLDNHDIRTWTRTCNKLRRDYRERITCRGGHTKVDSSGLHWKPAHIHAHNEAQNYLGYKQYIARHRHGLFLGQDVLISTEEIVEKLKTAPGIRVCDYVVPYSSHQLNERDLISYGANTGMKCHLFVNKAELDFLFRLCKKPPSVQYSDSNPDDKELEFATRSKMIRGDYEDDGILLASMTFLSSLYGGLHPTLWQHHFPTRIEMWMWRISSVVVAGWRLAIALVFISARPLSNTDTQKTRSLPTTTAILHTIFIVPVQVLLGLIMMMMVMSIDRFTGYTLFITVITVFGRIFLFIEAFISLRSQPLSVYQTPNWTHWLPHL